jgi:hypothetical protein
MWEYEWVECQTGDTHQLTELGRAGWEAVGMSPGGTSLGKTYINILMKRLAPADIDLSAPSEQPEHAAR